MSKPNEKKRNHKERWRSYHSGSLLLRLCRSINQLGGQATASAALGAIQLLASLGVPFVKSTSGGAVSQRPGCWWRRNSRTGFHIPRLVTAAFMSIRNVKGHEALIYRAKGLFLITPGNPRLGYLDIKEGGCDRMWRKVVGACWSFRQIHNCSKPDAAMGRRLIPEKESTRADLWDLKENQP